MAPVPEAAPGDPNRRARGGVREVVELAVPLVLTQLSTTAMGVVDSARVARFRAGAWRHIRI